MSDKTSVQVAVRIRPLVAIEKEKGCQDVVEVYKELNQLKIKTNGKAFTYNHVIDQTIPQHEFYSICVKEMVQNLFKGFNTTVLAYGQTGSGKTHSMGTCYNGEGEKGIIPLAIDDIFMTIRDNFAYDFNVTVSFIEIYQEDVYDLLAGKPREQCCLELREDAKGVFVQNLTEVPVKTALETLQCLSTASQGRAVASTNMNAQSSRSHAIFTVHISMQRKDDSNDTKTAKFHLVDLAGSERSKKTGATGQTFKEGVQINKGLLALGNVISALGDEKYHGSYINYRESSLTRILKDSLGGNSITLMIACISPADYNVEETVSTLRYADRAKKIKNKPIVNQDPQVAEILRLQRIVQQLRAENVAGGGSYVCPAEYEILQKQIVEYKTKCNAIYMQFIAGIAENGFLSEKLDNSETQLAELIIKVNELKVEFCKIITEITDRLEKAEAEIPKERIDTVQKILDEIIISQNNMLKCLKQQDMSNSHCSNKNSVCEPDIIEEQECHATEQLALNTQLKEVNKKLALKEQLMEHFIANTLNTADDDLIKGFQARIASLESEKEELTQQMRSAQSNGVSSKISENRRKRIQDLESQINDQKRKIVEQERLIKMKENDDKKIQQLRKEIIGMKQTKTDLMKKIRSESDRFRKWKLEKERDMQKLKQQDQKRQNQIARMEIMHSRQQNVLKRKVEEAAALNKRLKESLAKRKAVVEIRNGKTERTTEWIKHELEFYTNILAAKHTLVGLMEDRATLQQQLDDLKSQSETEELCNQLSDEISLRSAQIGDMQQKILDSQEDIRSQTRFDNIHSMAEAKQALKTLFDLVAEIKFALFQSENKLINQEQEGAINLKGLDKEVQLLNEKLIAMDEANANIEQQYQEKISLLLRRVEVEFQDDSNKKLWEIQNEKIDILTQENERLKAQNEELRKNNSHLNEKIEAINDTVKNSHSTGEEEFMLKKPRAKKKVAASNGTTKNDYKHMLVDTQVDSSDDDVKHDPDWRKTPMAKKMRKLTINGQESILGKVKRNSQGGCTCKGNCSGRNCGCKKTSTSCSKHCKCSESVCLNRNVSTDNIVEATLKEEEPDTTYSVPQLPDNDISTQTKRVRQVKK